MSEEKTEKKRRRRKATPKVVEQGLLEIAERCMEEQPNRVYNKSTGRWEDDGTTTFDAPNAIKALAELGRYLEEGGRGEGVRELRVDFGDHEDYAR